MQMALAILAAAAFTVGGAFMKQAEGFRHLGPTAAFIALFAMGAGLQSLAMRNAELGVVYVLVLGLEAAFAFGLGVVLFDERVTPVKLAAVALILAGITTLRVA